MEHLYRVVGPIATNVHVLADARSREAIAIDTATPSLAWIADELAARDWTLKLIVSTHGHWDHIGDNAAVAEHTGADIAVHALDRERLKHPAAALGTIRDRPVRAGRGPRGGRRGPLRRDPAAGPSHARPHGGLGVPAVRRRRCLFSGDTLFAGGWGRVDLPGGDPDAMAASLGRLGELEDAVRVFPGHGGATTIGRERAWLDLVREGGRLFA